MGGHNLDEGSIVVDLLNPVWQLAVPYKSMAAHLLAILRRPVRNLIGTTPAEASAVGLDSIPLHRIFGCNASELVLVPDDALFGIVVTDR